jgi:hypothetical protein
LTFRRGFKAEANRIALRVRKLLDLDPIAPIDPEAICAYFDIELVALSKIDPHSPFLCNTSVFSAVTVPRGIRTAIVHNDAHHIHRQRSNICHELAHGFLGHECAPPLNDDGARNYNRGIEAEANFLGGALLITNEAAIHIVSKGLVADAHNIFGVSTAMVTYRLRMSGAHVIYERRMQSARRAS